jgi:hypothetical protein
MLLSKLTQISTYINDMSFIFNKEKTDIDTDKSISDYLKISSCT